MIASLTAVVDDVERRLAADPAASIDVAALARAAGTTEHHLRRMFSSLAGMPLSDYVRRRRMAAAAADLIATDDDLLTIAVRHGYGSAEAFGRAFRSVHGTVVEGVSPFLSSARLLTLLKVEPGAACP